MRIKRKITVGSSYKLSCKTMENINIYVQKAKEQLEARQKLVKSFVDKNPMPEVEYCKKHPKVAITSYEAEFVEDTNQVEWVKSYIGCKVCENEEKLTELMEMANIPPRYFDVKASDKYRHYVDNDKGILFTGGVGTGKTYELVALMKSLILSGKSVMFRTFGEICRQIRDAVGNNTYTELYNKYLNTDIFVIDDLGVENSTPFIKEFLYNLINDLYNNKKVILMTTNLTSTELLANYTQRVVSRLNEMCAIVKLEGQDRRNKKILVENKGSLDKK